MPRLDGHLRITVTGAAGFIGRAVVDRILGGAMGRCEALRLNDIGMIDRPGTTFVRGSYAEADVREALVADGIDVLFHLASLPGGASERDPVMGRRSNLDGSIALVDAAARAGCPIIVYASSIAALGIQRSPVSHSTALRPTSSYGTHKAMIELYLADLTRRGLVDARSVRPAGIVARPRESYGGFATAWMSDLFHAAAEGRDIDVPARRDAHVWLQSVDMVADNLVHAARMAGDGLAPHRAWTLPASVVRIGALADALRGATHHDARVTFTDTPFDQPPLDASDALAIGFRCDGDVDALVETVLSRLAITR